MNRATRDKFATRTQADLTTGNACWETAPIIFEQLNADHGPFEIDLTADAQRALCPLWFGPGSPAGEYDALTAEWHTYGTRGYSNPPYGPFVGRRGPKGVHLGILPKAKIEAEQGFTSEFLLPLRITGAFRQYVLRGASDVILPTKRLVFFENGLPRCSYNEKGKPRADVAMFDSMLVRYRPGTWDGPRISEWTVPKHVLKSHIEQWVALHPYDKWKAAQAAKKAA